MSSIEEKLQLFNEIILKDAIAERDRKLEKLRSEIRNTIESKREDLQEQVDELLKKELSAAEQEKNNIISKAMLESRQLLMKTREDILDAVMDDVKKGLNEFISSEDYLPYLIDQIKQSCAQAGEGELVVYLTEADMGRLASRLDNLRKELFPSISFETIYEDVIGGCRVLNKTLNTLVDNTFSRRLEYAMDSFMETSGLKIDLN